MAPRARSLDHLLQLPAPTWGLSWSLPAPSMPAPLKEFSHGGYVGPAKGESTRRVTPTFGVLNVVQIKKSTREARTTAMLHMVQKHGGQQLIQ